MNSLNNYFFLDKNIYIKRLNKLRILIRLYLKILPDFRAKWRVFEVILIQEPLTLIPERQSLTFERSYMTNSYKTCNNYLWH